LFVAEHFGAPFDVAPNSPVPVGIAAVAKSQLQAFGWKEKIGGAAAAG
jgi:hypothetical protein